MHIPTILKRLQAVSAFIFCLSFLSFIVHPVWAQSTDDKPVPSIEGSSWAIPLSTGTETPEDDDPPPGGGGGYERRSQSTPNALAAATLAEQPTKPALLGNYPNPFNPETTVRFAVQEGQHVRLTVFNLLGQSVQVLVDGYMEAGQHEAHFVAQDLPSGTYFTRLETRTGVAIQKMVLAK